MIPKNIITLLKKSVIISSDELYNNNLIIT